MAYAYPSFASYPGYPYGAFPTAFAAAPAAQSNASAAEGSQADEAASQHGVSVSGFGAPIVADQGYFGFPYGAAPYVHGQTIIAGAPQATYLAPQPTFLAPTALVPVAAPRVRRPGYNERLVAWRNRQKAFNRYKRQTKEAIRNASSAHHTALYTAPGAPAIAPTVFAQPTYFGAQPTVIGGYAPFPAYAGATYLAPSSYLLPQAFPQEQAQEQQQEYHQDSFGFQNNQQEVQQEEPEIRGTQV